MTKSTSLRNDVMTKSTVPLENIPGRGPDSGCLSLDLVCYEAVVAAVDR